MIDRYATERRLAPHVDQRWAETLLLELRLRGVPGDAIGGVLAEVDSHVAESGETAVDAFGDPVEYARSLDLPTEEPTDARAVLRSTAPTAVQVAGLLVLAWSASPAVRGEPLDLTWGHVALVALLAVELLLLVRYADAVLGAVVRRPVLSWLASLPVLGMPVALLVLLRDVVANVPSLAAAVVGGVLLVAGTAWAMTRSRAGVDADPVQPPLAEAALSGRVDRVLATGGVWLVPAAAVLTVALALATRTS